MYLYVSDSLDKQSSPVINYYKLVKSDVDSTVKWTDLAHLES